MTEAVPVAALVVLGQVGQVGEQGVELAVCVSVSVPMTPSVSPFLLVPIPGIAAVSVQGVVVALQCWGC